MSPAETLHVDELVLRRWQPGDAAELYAAVRGSLDTLARWMPWAHTGYCFADADAFCVAAVREWDADKNYAYAIRVSTGELIGNAALMARVGGGGLEIGYWVTDAWSGRGVATRAAGLLSDEAARIGARFVEIHHDRANVRSGAIPRRLGFVHAGTGTPAVPGGTATTGVNDVWRWHP